MASQLEKDPELSVTRTRGRISELRVSVDGVDAVTIHPLAYPTPTSVVARVREHLARGDR